MFVRKELCSNQVHFQGKAIPFDCLPSNVGTLKIDEGQQPELAAFIKDCVSKRKGGIVLIDEAEYEEIKKNKTGRVSAAFLPQERLKVLPPVSPPQKSQDVAVENPVQKNGDVQANAAKPADVASPFKPASGKAVKAKSKPTAE